MENTAIVMLFDLIRSIPAWLSWIRYISWFYYGYSALMINQWSGVQHIACQSNSTSACVKTGREVLETLNIDEVRAEVDKYYRSLHSVGNISSQNLSGIFYCWFYWLPSSGSLPSSLSAGKQGGNPSDYHLLKIKQCFSFKIKIKFLKRFSTANND